MGLNEEVFVLTSTQVRTLGQLEILVDFDHRHCLQRCARTAPILSTMGPEIVLKPASKMNILELPLIDPVDKEQGRHINEEEEILKMDRYLADGLGVNDKPSVAQLFLASTTATRTVLDGEAEHAIDRWLIQA